MKRLIAYTLLSGILGLGFWVIYPVHNGLSRLALLLGVFGVLASLLVVSWKRQPWRWISIGVVMILAAPFLLPGRHLDEASLRDDYIRALRSYDGSTYYWGGEKASGIDCSGLPRRALRDALFSQGLKTLNGRAMRMGLEQWWFDTSASAMRKGYRGFTAPRNIEGRIESLSTEGIQPGDLAVTTSGVHVLVYLGDGEWIQADPSAKKVNIQHGGSEQNAWFTLPVEIHHWSQLQ